MGVELRPMTKEAYAHFYAWSVEQQAKQRMERSGLSWKASHKEAEAEITAMLPNGMETKDHLLMSIVADGVTVGFVWTLHEMTNGRKQSFLCDFAIWEEKRRRGYGSEALRLAEENAAMAGCVESVLYVADDNTAARRMYEKCGYRTLRQAGGGEYMMKDIFVAKEHKL